MSAPQSNCYPYLQYSNPPNNQILQNQPNIANT